MYKADNKLLSDCKTYELMARTNIYIKKYANGNRIEEITIPAMAKGFPFVPVLFVFLRPTIENIRPSIGPAAVMKTMAKINMLYTAIKAELS